MARKIIITPAGEARADRVRRFAQLHVRHMKDRWAGKPFVLEPWQYEQMVRPVYGQLDRRGRRKIKRALYCYPRWQGKSESTALLHMYHLYGEPVYGGEQYAFATTRQQAAIIFDTAKRMIGADPLLAAATKVYRSVIEVKETGTIFRCLPFDADTSQGFHPTFASGDEIHVMKNLEMVDAMVTGMVGREEGLFVAITTAGSKPGVLEELVEQWKHDPAAYVYWHGAPADADPHDPAVWRAANPASWITMEMLRSQYRALPLPVFERLHLNRTPQGLGSDQAFDPRDWKECQRTPDWDPDVPCVVTGDAGMKRDRMTVACVQRLKDGTINAEVWIWDDVDEDSGRRNVREAEDLLLHLWQTRKVARMALDPALWWRSMEVLEQDYGIPIEEFPQSPERMCPASQALLDVVREHRIRAGRDPRLAEHMANATVLERPPRGWRIGKPSKNQHIDAAIALAMAVYLVEGESATPSFAETGGVWTLPLR